MKQSLSELTRELERIESVVMEEYVRLETEVAGEGKAYARISAPFAARLRHYLIEAWDGLSVVGRSASGLSGEDWEELRRRLVAMDGIIQRDVPFSYLDRSTAPAVGMPPRPRPLRVSTPPHRRDWLVRLVRGLRSGLGFEVGEGRGRAHSAPRNAVPSPPERAPVLLYTLMQKDAQHLVPPGQGLPPLAPGLGLSREPVRFEMRGTLEKVRNLPVESDFIVVIPEELRRGLQTRRFLYGELNPTFRRSSPTQVTANVLYPSFKVRPQVAARRQRGQGPVPSGRIAGK